MNNNSRGGSGSDATRRLAEVEAALDRVERRMAAIEIDANSSKRRLNAVVDFYEHRIDQIYRQVVNELGRALNTGGVTADSEADIDRQLTHIFGLSLKDAPTDIAEHVASALTDEIRPGQIKAPLTLAGFRLDRSRCRETENGVEVFSKDLSGAGIAVYGPYRRLKPGSYKLKAVLGYSRLLRLRGLLPLGSLVLDVYSSHLDRVVSQVKVGAVGIFAGRAPTLEFDWSTEASAGPIEFRLHQRSNVNFLHVGFSLTVSP